MTKPILAGLAALAGIVVLFFGVLAFQYFTADTRGAVAQQELVRADGQFRLAAYNHFFDLCTSIQSDERRVKNLRDELAAGNLTPARANTLPSIITATLNSRDANIAKYNNDAQKAGSIGIFRSNKLPFYINPNQEETQCIL